MLQMKNVLDFGGALPLWADGRGEPEVPLGEAKALPRKRTAEGYRLLLIPGSHPGAVAGLAGRQIEQRVLSIDGDPAGQLNRHADGFARTAKGGTGRIPRYIVLIAASAAIDLPL